MGLLAADDEQRHEQDHRNEEEERPERIGDDGDTGIDEGQRQIERIAGVGWTFELRRARA